VLVKIMTMMKTIVKERMNRKKQMAMATLITIMSLEILMRSLKNWIKVNAMRVKLVVHILLWKVTLSIVVIK